MSSVVTLILCGGAGTRLWPVSRMAYPKPFIRLPDGRSLLQRTIDCASSCGGSTMLIGTNREYYFQARDEADASVLAQGFEKHYLLEPQGRNTAPAIVMAALWARQLYGPETILLALAADHVIDGETALKAAVDQAIAAAEAGFLVTFGVPPTAPDTGYGYIEVGPPILTSAGFAVTRFVEKPSRQTAEAYVDSGKFLWNSGLFCFRVDALVAGMDEHAPDLLKAATACWQATIGRAHEPGRVELESESFGQLDAISIDYALMEKASNVAVVKAGFEWSDVGSWEALSALTEADANGNRVEGEATLIDVENSYVHSSGRLVAAVGVRDLIIVETADALLVVHRDRHQDVKRVVQELDARRHSAALHHTTVYRPWGTYTVLEEGRHFKIKRIVVKPGRALSLQSHRHRSEHWVVVDGEAEVLNGDEVLLLRKSESTYIVAGHKHRLRNVGLADLVLIEVQTGDYLGEDDIVRYEDSFGRVKAAT